MIDYKNVSIDRFIQQIPLILRHPAVSYEFRDDDTYVLRDLKKLLNKGMLSSYLTYIGYEHLISFIMPYAIGHKGFSNQTVFRCRAFFQPARWYYQISERVPAPVSYSPHAEPPDLLCKESQGHVRLREMMNINGVNLSFRAFAEMFNLPPATVVNMFQTRTAKNKIKQFRALPSPAVIQTLRKQIHPDLWFIFPEEIQEKGE